MVTLLLRLGCRIRHRYWTSSQILRPRYCRSSQWKLASLRIVQKLSCLLIWILLSWKNIRIQKQTNKQKTNKQTKTNDAVIATTDLNSSKPLYIQFLTHFYKKQPHFVRFSRKGSLLHWWPDGIEQLNGRWPRLVTHFPAYWPGGRATNLLCMGFLEIIEKI